MSVVEERRFSLFDAQGKNNKFWNVFLMDNGDVKVNFGPQGKGGQHKTFPSSHAKGGRAGFESQIRSKTNPKKKGGPYTENEVLDTGEATTAPRAATTSKTELKQRAVADIAGGCPQLASLIEYFTEVNAHNLLEASGGRITYDVDSGLFRTTQGVVTLSQIQRARKFLDEIAKYAAKKVFDGDDFFSLLNPYLTLIPQEGLVRQLDFADMFGIKSGGLQRQGDILDGLEASHSQVTATPKKKKKDGDKPASLFKVDLSEVSTRGKEFANIRELYRSTKGGHRDVAHYDVRKVYTLRIEVMAVDFLKKGSKVGNIMQLWHGTKASNVLSILKGGMIIPPSSSHHVTGRMFGDGLYFSDQSTKSIRYATGAWGGGGHSDRKFMFLVDVAMGKCYIPRGSNWHLKLPTGYNSTFAKAHNSGVMNNEMIVYNATQVNPVFLIEFTPGGR